MTDDILARSVSRRNLLIGAGLIGTVAAAASWIPQQEAKSLSEKQFDALFPKQFGQWTYLTASGLVLPPQDQLSKMLYERLLTRVYLGPGNAQVMLLLAYSSVQEGRLQVHRPEVCYPAAGFTITENIQRPVRLDGRVDIPTRFLVAQSPARSECLSYWTRVGPSLPTRWFDQRLVMAQENLKGRIPDGMLARVSTAGMEPTEGAQVLDGFLKDLFAALQPPGRALLIGPR